MNTPDFYEKKIYSTDFPFQIFYENRDQRGVQCSAHWHEEIEFAYVVKGSVVYTLEQNEYTLKKGDFLIINSNTIHSATCLSVPYSCQIMAFRIESILKTLDISSLYFQPFIGKDSQIKFYMEQIFKECEKKELEYKNNCIAYITQLIIYLLRNYSSQNTPNQLNAQNKIRLEQLDNILKYIDEHYTESISNKDLANMMYLSEDHFSHLFRKKMGTSPQRYISQIRLQKAQTLILSREHTITEIARMVGYNDYNHFGRQFRRYFGCSPSDMAKQNVYASNREFPEQ